MKLIQTENNKSLLNSYEWKEVYTCGQTTLCLWFDSDGEYVEITLFTAKGDYDLQVNNYIYDEPITVTGNCNGYTVTLVQADDFKSFSLTYKKN